MCFLWQNNEEPHIFDGVLKAWYCSSIGQNKHIHVKTKKYPLENNDINHLQSTKYYGLLFDGL